MEQGRLSTLLLLRIRNQHVNYLSKKTMRGNRGFDYHIQRNTHFLNLNYVVRINKKIKKQIYTLEH